MTDYCRFLAKRTPHGGYFIFGSLRISHLYKHLIHHKWSPFSHWRRLVSHIVFPHRLTSFEARDGCIFGILISPSEHFHVSRGGLRTVGDACPYGEGRNDDFCRKSPFSRNRGGGGGQAYCGDNGRRGRGQTPRGSPFLCPKAHP